MPRPEPAFVSSLAYQYPRVIFPGDYPDPSILRDGEDYYITHSPFLYVPGFLIWHSRDLVNWTPLCRAATKMVGSAMAPELVKCDGRYFIYFPAAEYNWVIWTDNICGPWSDPIRLHVGQIDPGHIVDEIGRRWLFLSEGYRIRLADDGLSVVGEKEKVYSGWQFPSDWETEGMWLESPKIIRHGNYFYMLVAQGGTAGPPTSHMVAAARAKCLCGPWENSTCNPIIHTYSPDEPWWSKGHGTLIDDTQGRWWVVYHAYANGAYPLGRQTLIEPVEWMDNGWFRPAACSPPLPDGGLKINFSDEFSGKELGLQWMSWRSYEPETIKLNNGSLSLQAKGANPKDAHLLLTTATNRSYEIQIEVAVSPGADGGLILFYSDEAYAGVSSDGKKFALYKDGRRVVYNSSHFGERFFLKITNRRDCCTFLASADGIAWTTLMRNVDVSQMHHNKFKGFFALRPGLMAAGKGEVNFNHFEYRPISNIT